MELSDSFLRKICLFLSLAGIISLAFLAQLQEGKHLKVGDISKSHISQKISTEGIVAWGRLSSGTLFFELSDNGRIRVTMFSPSPEDIAAAGKNNAVRVTGTIQLYKGSLGLVAEKVERI